METISGSCLCQKIKFTCDNRFTEFHFCHCVQCQKASGSAHVANLFTDKANIQWLSGKALVKRYDQPGRSIATAFCTECGSPVPYISGGSGALIVPAGCLDASPNLMPEDNIFWEERATWYECGLATKKYPGFPE